jgi:plastocyanin
MKRLFLPVVLLIFSLVMVACGGSEETAVAEPVSISVSGSDSFVFDPATVTVKTGQEVTLRFENEGALQHSWVLIRNTTEADGATDADAVQGITTGPVESGETSSLTFIAPAAGTYQIVCTIVGHATGGMVGELIVEQ